MLDFLREEISEELADQKKSRTGTNKRSREDFVRFKAFCQRWTPPLSHLPAAPATVGGFLTSELDGADHTCAASSKRFPARIKKPISTTPPAIC
jgi:hypothetical protein